MEVRWTGREGKGDTGGEKGIKGKVEGRIEIKGKKRDGGAKRDRRRCECVFESYSGERERERAYVKIQSKP